jgi:hypothetical protein
MSRRDKSRLLTIAKVLGIAALLAAVVWVGMCIREWEHARIAAIVVEKMRGGR